MQENFAEQARSLSTLPASHLFSSTYLRTLSPAAKPRTVECWGLVLMSCILGGFPCGFVFKLQHSNTQIWLSAQFLQLQGHCPLSYRGFEALVIYGWPLPEFSGHTGDTLMSAHEEKNTAHENNAHEKASPRGSIAADKQGVSEDLVPLACSCASPRPPHQNDDLVLGVCRSRKSTGQPCLRAERHWILPLGLVCFPVWEQWCCRCKLLALTSQLFLLWRWNMVQHEANADARTHSRGDYWGTAVQLWETQKQLSLKVIVLGLPVILCLHCADRYSFIDINISSRQRRSPVDLNLNGKRQTTTFLAK